MHRSWIPIMLLMGASNAMPGQPAYSLRIETTARGDLLTVVPYVESSAAATLRYRLVSTKQGKAGSSTTNQEGTVSLACCRPQPVSSLSLSVDASDRYVISVTLFEGANIVAQETLRYPQ
jgi:curli production protein